MQTTQPVNTVLIDDSNRSIQYGPGWVNKPSLLAQSDPHYPMYGTLHETVNQTDLTYSFSGSTITACAQFVAPINTSLFHLSLWTCSVDGVQIATLLDLTNFGPTQGFVTLCCGEAKLNTQVQHDIYISAIGSKDQPMLFDYLTYGTSLAVPTADLLMGGDDPAFRNMEGWEVQDVPSLTNAGIEALATTEPEANFTFDFYGSSILWSGFYNTSFMGYSASSFSFSVDNEFQYSTDGYLEIELDPSVAKMSLNGSSVVQFLVFRTFAVPRGQHRLQVTYYGSRDPGIPMPLTLTNLVVQNSTINPNPESSVPTTIPTPLRTNGARRAHLAIILGCCGAAALALVIFFARRRVKIRRDRASPESGTSSLVEPFNHDSSSAPVEPHQKGQPPSGLQEQVVVETAEVQVDAPPSYVTGQHDS